MAQGGSQLDYHILQDLKQRFPEIPEGVVSQYLLQVHNTDSFMLFKTFGRPLDLYRGFLIPPIVCMYGYDLIKMPHD